MDEILTQTKGTEGTVPPGGEGGGVVVPPAPPEAKPKEGEGLPDEREVQITALQADLAKSSKELGRTLKALQNLQGERDSLAATGEDKDARLAELEAEVSARPSGSDWREPPVRRPDADGRDGYPRLRGLQRDEDGNVIVDGVVWTPQLADRILKTEEQLAELTTDRDQRVETEEQQRLQKLNAQLYEDAGNMIAGIRAKQFPDLEEARAKRMDARILRETDDLLLKRLEKGEKPSVELINECIADSFVAELEDHGHFAKRQLEGNQQTRERQKAKPGGAAGVAAEKTRHQMTQRELEQAGDAIWKQIQAETGESA